MIRIYGALIVLNTKEFNEINLTQHKDLIELYKTKTLLEIADIYGCSGYPIRVLLRERGINVSAKRYNIKFTNPETTNIIKLYKTNTCVDIGKKYGFSDYIIRNLLNNNGINTSKKVIMTMKLNNL